MIEKKRTRVLAYLATPSRFADRRQEICEYVVAQGAHPFHPFNAFPYDLYEGHPDVGRKEAMAVCFDAVSFCDEFWLFGVSSGTLQEVCIAQQLVKPVRLHLGFDPKWREFYQKLGPQFGMPLDEMLEKYSLDF